MLAAVQQPVAVSCFGAKLSAAACRDKPSWYLLSDKDNALAPELQRWMAQRPGLDPDIWIETVDYKETREYIMRVLAFSVIYDWRLDGKAVPLTDRMLGRTVPDAGKRHFVCNVPTPVAAEAAP